MLKNISFKWAAFSVIAVLILINKAIPDPDQEHKEYQKILQANEIRNAVTQCYARTKDYATCQKGHDPYGITK